MADSTAPNTGTEKLNTVTWLTRLCLSSRLHSENAAEDSSARYTSSRVDCQVKPVSEPPRPQPMASSAAPPRASCQPVMTIESMRCDTCLP